ncbi:endonuclease YncB(thermonuclease family) [Azospirillum agricola]|uniref:thermonuclease family protein n=1 Tax=Azospirillum agricola TaxID=1720247 RepID=UPI001AE4ED63|nr:thermonuclease family protein [Azospirillum agricola]MBP2232364.1 endonuclease YncB(thermonuclease family) [Azospirillum agricola]
MRRFCLLALSLLLAAAAPVERWRVTAVLDGDTLELEDGRRIRLAGIEAAKPPRNAPSDEERRWPLAEAAAAALSELALGRLVTTHGETAPDRHGRTMAHLLRDDGLWLQAEMLARGHARVHTRPDARAYAREMLATEDGARGARRGLWRTRVYAVRDADPGALARDRDSFQIVEGRVLRVSKTGGEAYLDFGEDWRTDVTVHISRPVMRDFAKAGIDPLSYEGRRVRVRGWIGLRSGPMIDITHPEQIERLEGGAAPARPSPPVDAAADADIEEEDSE